MSGVYNSSYEVATDGGPKCASESTFGFKYALNQILLIIELIIVYKGVTHIVRHFETKKNYLIKSGRGLNPSLIEYT